MQHSLDDKSIFDIPDNVSQIANTFSTYGALFDILDTVCHNFFSILQRVCFTNCETPCPLSVSTYREKVSTTLHTSNKLGNRIQICMHLWLYIYTSTNIYKQIYMRAFVCVHMRTHSYMKNEFCMLLFVSSVVTWYVCACTQIHVHQAYIYIRSCAHTSTRSTLTPLAKYELRSHHSHVDVSWHTHTSSSWAP